MPWSHGVVNSTYTFILSVTTYTSQVSIYTAHAGISSQPVQVRLGLPLPITYLESQDGPNLSGHLSITKDSPAWILGMTSGYGVNLYKTDATWWDFNNAPMVIGISTPPPQNSLRKRSFLRLPAFFLVVITTRDVDCQMERKTAFTIMARKINSSIFLMVKVKQVMRNIQNTAARFAIVF